MGIHDISNEGQFTYDSDGKDIVWTNWHKGEPNDFGKGEDCVRSGHGHRGVNKWNDSPCNDKYSFICEKSGIPTIMNFRDMITRKGTHEQYKIFHSLKKMSYI